MGKYDNATQEELDVCLREILSEMNTEQILSYGEVYSFFLEEFNNEVLSRWETRFSVSLYAIQQEYQDKCRVKQTQSEFKDVYVNILAKKIMIEADFTSYDILGPFGLNCNYFIDFKKGDDDFYFSFFEQRLDGQIGIHKKREGILELEYKPGTVGSYNQGNMDSIALPLNTKISDIIKKYVIKERND